MIVDQLAKAANCPLGRARKWLDPITDAKEPL